MGNLTAAELVMIIGAIGVVLVNIISAWRTNAKVDANSQKTDRAAEKAERAERAALKAAQANVETGDKIKENDAKTDKLAGSIGSMHDAINGASKEMRDELKATRVEVTETKEALAGMKVAAGPTLTAKVAESLVKPPVHDNDDKEPSAKPKKK